MEPINVNHAYYLTSIKTSGLSNNDLVFESSSTQAEPAISKDEITLSPASVALYQSELGASRFSSLEEQSASKTKQVNSWLTLEELESGVRRPFVDSEEARLSTLSLAELMEEMNNLPNIDEHGHLQTAFAGTEQGDRLGNAAANIALQSQYNLEQASKSVSESLDEFKQQLESELGIDPDKYNIIFKDGKITVIGVGKDSLNNPIVTKIQALLDDSKNNAKANKLVNDIEKYNEAAAKIINNRLTIYTVGAIQNRYLPKELAINEIMEGMDYSNTGTRTHLYDKWLDIVAEANQSFRAAIEDGSHLENSSINPGILELTRMRQEQNNSQ